MMVLLDLIALIFEVLLASNAMFADESSVLR
jgi:hypothetical protein